jgi:hypothetical protein
MMRATWSTDPPGGNTATRRIAWRVGHAWAEANMGALIAHMKNAVRPNFFVQTPMRKLPIKIKDSLLRIVL